MVGGLRAAGGGLGATIEAHDRMFLERLVQLPFSFDTSFLSSFFLSFSPLSFFSSLFLLGVGVAAPPPAYTPVILNKANTIAPKIDKIVVCPPHFNGSCYATVFCYGFIQSKSTTDRTLAIS